MSYRNDHDAAVSRVASLERDLNELTVERDRLRYQLAVIGDAKREPMVVGSKWTLPIVLVFGTVTAIVFFLTYVRDYQPEPLPVSAPVYDAPINRIGHCLDRVIATQRDQGVYDERTTDPHGELKIDVRQVATLGADCRDQLARVVVDRKSPVGQWLTAEDELAGDITRILVYYGNNPYQLDGYSTAKQLWREFARDRAARDAVINRIAPALEDAAAR